MHPAASIIFFTVFSGVGYSLLFLLGLFAALGVLPDDSSLGGAGLGLALLLIVTGLFSSTLHLGHPERAWRALSQWRSSWLSREGVAALLTFLPTLVFAYGWLVEGEIWRVAGLITALGAAATVGCTAMIYACLKTVARWRNGFTLPLYLLHGLGAGALGYAFLASLWGRGADWVFILALVLLTAAWALQALYWRSLPQLTCKATPESATGLGAIGKVRLLEAPHSGENYLLKEMAFAIGRKHARKLKRLAFLFGLALPLAATALAAQLTESWIGAPLQLLAFVSALLGLLVQRWLFFAEARHTVTLYYGAAEA
jgi:DMSO reductase anchor subunit